MLVYQRVSHYVLITSEESTWNANAFLSYGLKGSKKKATGLQKYRPGDICNRSYSRHFQTPVTETYLSQHSWYTFQSTSQKQPWDWHMVSTIHIHIQSHIYLYIIHIQSYIYIHMYVYWRNRLHRFQSPERRNVVLLWRIPGNGCRAFQVAPRSRHPPWSLSVSLSYYISWCIFRTYHDLIYIYIHACIYIYTYIYIHIIYFYIDIYMHIHIHIRICICVCMYMYIYMDLMKVSILSSVVASHHLISWICIQSHSKPVKIQWQCLINHNIPTNIEIIEICITHTHAHAHTHRHKHTLTRIYIYIII
jgi:hypothetical protein